MSQGTVKWFNDQKGFGFISSEDGTDYFVHHSGIIADGFKTLPEGAQVQFTVEKSERGLRAVQVSVVK
jgi:CspA family cold shock protein